MDYFRSETSEARILRLIQATMEGYPVGNLKAAMDELKYLANEYREIAEVIKEKSTELNEKSKILREALYVLNKACSEFSKVQSRVLKSLRNCELEAKILSKEMAILKAEFNEVNKALMELIRRRWWTW